MRPAGRAAGRSVGRAVGRAVDRQKPHLHPADKTTQRPGLKPSALGEGNTYSPQGRHHRGIGRARPLPYRAIHV